MTALNLDTDSWQPARLIPTAGIKGAREREQRATSALLAVVAAVPEFGRELLKDLGAPAGKRAKISTYTEVPLDDGDDGTLRPDGVIVVEHGKTQWSALVEVKTGKNRADAEQVTRYLEAAKREGFDGVLIIDNVILGGADDVPVVVSKQKLRKTSLWQLSWWRIVTEMVLQHDHRGVSASDQAFILSELIAYLLHPNSGVAEFEDMGKAWVKVRDGARHSTLTGRQPEVIEIARRWEQLVHYTALSLTQDLGRPVTPERVKYPLEERLEQTIQQLTDSGCLSMNLRIPDAIGRLKLEADLRARVVTTSVEVRAPREGRPDTQVRWILRQLKQAPNDLRIETKFVRTSKSTTLLLEDVRDKAKAALLPEDPKREPRAFQLSLTRPMGIKKAGPGSFVDETRQQAVDFYRDLVQFLRDWQPRAPKLREPKQTAPNQSTTSAPAAEEPLNSPAHDDHGSERASEPERVD